MMFGTCKLKQLQIIMWLLQIKKKKIRRKQCIFNVQDELTPTNWPWQNENKTIPHFFHHGDDFCTAHLFFSTTSMKINWSNSSFEGMHSSAEELWTLETPRLWVDGLRIVPLSLALFTSNLLVSSQGLRMGILAWAGKVAGLSCKQLVTLSQQICH